ncbi:AAA family ATPase [Paenibacillus sp. FSL R7-0204]|uniref:AAA family ATPase n=1 Tax=Paenibacillus sp. FSL R7-0204 TaxID=2921675 RepID=UPI0030FB89AA
MDRTLNLLNRIILILTAIYAFMAVLGAFSSDPAVDHAEVVFLCYGATAFLLFLTGLSLPRKVAEICAIIAYGCFAFSVACGLFGLSIAGLAAGVAVIVAIMRQRYQNLDSVYITGCMLSYWIVMYGFAVTLIGKVPLITKGWDVIFYPFYYEGIKHIALSWRGLLVLFGGWLFARFVNRARMATYQATKQSQVETPVQVYTQPTRPVQRVSAAAAVLAVPEPPILQEAIDDEEYGDEEEYIEDNEDENEVSEDREEVLHAALAALDQMVGLAPLKAEIQSFMKHMHGHLITQRLGKIASTKPTLHMIFSGPPGTGKTEMARIMVDLLYGLNLIEERVLIEADRSSIVGTHIGQTEERMIHLLEAAWGGVLFIDEAYALAKSDSPSDFGQEAIDVLIKAMEDYREDIVVIMAGYASDMERFLDMNQGFRSRVSYAFAFADYTPHELSQIALHMLEAKGYDCSFIKDEIQGIVNFCHRNGAIQGNGRWARNFVERIVKEHNVRVSAENTDRYVGKILPDDLRLAAGMPRKYGDQEINHAAIGKRELRDEAMQELQAMVGLTSLKEQVQSILHHVEVEQKRIQQGLSTEAISMHMLFEGSPGTGKTTVARIIGKFLNGLGLLTNGHVVETDRSGIVGRFIGHTEANMRELIAKAKGGILFIDEAYALAKTDSPNDFGREAIDVLVKAMEDHRGELVVILAGYSKEMQDLLSLNPGLSSRIPFRFGFADYDAHEIVEIVKRSFASKQFVLTADAVEALEERVAALSAQAEGLEGNGRWARNLLDKVRMEQNNRLVRIGASDLMTIEAEDIERVIQHM